MPDRVTDRLPIFSALKVLGLSYAEIGRLLGVSTVSVHHWAVGKKPLPLVRFLALQFLVGRLVGIIGGQYPPQTRMPAARTSLGMLPRPTCGSPATSSRRTVAAYIALRISSAP